MEIICQHCNNDIEANFCSNCGQKRYKRIDRKYVLDELQYLLVHTNKGFPYSVKNIIKNPGRTAKQFIIGDRVNHYKPLLLVFLLSGIATFLSFKVIGLGEVMREYYTNQDLNSKLMTDVMSLLSSYNSVFTLLLIPFFALSTKIAFGNWGQNYYEHIIMNSYVVSFYTIFSIAIIYPILFLFRHNTEAFLLVTTLSILTVPFILIWFFKDFYPNKPLKAVIGRVLLSLLLVGAAYFIFIILVALGGIIYATVGGPEALEYIKPRKL